jgi:hypothetical protein
VWIILRVEISHFDHELCILFFPTSLMKNESFITQFKFSSLVMQTPIFLTKLGDESMIFISDVGKMPFLHSNLFVLKNSSLFNKPLLRITQY